MNSVLQKDPENGVNGSDVVQVPVTEKLRGRDIRVC
jgi:hypothetical protein